MQAPQDPGLSTTVDAASSVGEAASPALVRDTPMLRAGEVVDRYQVRRLVAQGGMGRIYLARDVTLGRSVALKLIRPDRAASPDDLLAEARATATVNHPHIVQVYELGRYGPYAYLALEYLEGESLRDRLARGPLSIDEGLRVLRAIADALDHAHGKHVLHCDLKPGNVMLPVDGRVRVVDFGLAVIRAATSTAAGGTPDWMAPEQWRGEPVAEPCDVWAFAVMAHELLVGAHPFGVAGSAEERRRQVLDPACAPAALTVPGVPDQLRALALRSLARDPAVRPSARDWYLALDGALTGGGATTADGPFRGLAAFDERHAALFFGRERDVDELMERLRERTTVPIVGPSGAGKSSFLLAGVIPRLRARGGWTIVVVRPGAAPFTALAHRVLAALDEQPGTAAVAALAQQLREAPSLLAVRLATIAAARRGQVLLAIDQLEEIFTQGSTAREVEAFLAMLSALDDPGEPARIAYTIRDDMLWRVPRYRDPFAIGRLGVDDVRRTITAPVERLGYRFENPAIVDDMLAETRGALVELPLVQFACRALWDARDQERKLLLASVYAEQGGVTGALARHADSVIEAMTAGEQQISRTLFGRLVVGTSARRIVERDALLADLPAGAEAVLDRLIGARLLAQQRPPGEAAPTVELVHESLLVNWARLRAWLDESSEERRLLDELDEQAGLWERRGAGDEATLPEEELAAARVRVARLGLALPPRTARFLRASDELHRRRRRRARWRLAAIVAAALTLALGAAIAANVFRRQKLEAQAQAEALRLAADDLGRFVLVLQPFDWHGDEVAPVDPALLPDLRVSFYQPDADDPELPGAQVDGRLVHELGHAPGRWYLEAPGGTTYLRFDGRGRAGERCAASWLRVKSVPGYADRLVLHRLDLTIPTCAASADDTITIPAGDFIYGGPGDPPTRYSTYVQPERTVHLDTFSIDRTELSNARYRPFAALASATGYPVHGYPTDDILAGAGRSDAPVSSVDAFTAEALCRFYGKRLPKDEEWTKAARGGLSLGNTLNPHPRRLFPWGATPAPCANLEGDADGFPWIAPAGALQCGASPYGVLDLAGNVQEWIARSGQTSESALRVVRGGGADSPVELEHGTTVFRNARDVRFFSFSVGVRCVAGGNPEEESTWREH